MIPPFPDPNGELNSSTESPNSVVVVIDGPADTTHRPRRPNVPLPGQEPRPYPSPPDKN
jgi:hypothetical protein